ncbi:MAG TPA: hypothetical protein VFQ65_32980, partial [Kofleriaceae bacterium]|nr:hypothetical protein [Kofleriaceae bacterium]
MIRAAAIACVGCAMGCAVERAPATSTVAVGGDSPLAALFVRVAADAGIPADELAAASWVTTRFQLAGDPEVSVRADAELIREGSLEQLGGEGLVRDV